VSPAVNYAFQQCPFRGMHFHPEGPDERDESIRQHKAETGHVFVTWEMSGAIEPRKDMMSAAEDAADACRRESP